MTVTVRVTVTASENHDKYSKWASDFNISFSFACSCALFASKWDWAWVKGCD